MLDGFVSVMSIADARGLAVLTGTLGTVATAGLIDDRRAGIGEAGDYQ